EGQPPQPLPQLASVPLAALGQGQIGPSRVLARKAPGRLTVSRQVNKWKRLAHEFPPGVPTTASVCRAIVISSSVGITRTVTGLPSGEITPAATAFRAESMLTPRNSSLAQM